MATTPVNEDITEREIRSILIRHLPIGLEGVGIAQSGAVLQALRRRHGTRSRPVLDEDRRQGMRLLGETAEAHRASLLPSTTSASKRYCGLCVTPEGGREAWPCPVWTSAELLGVVETSTDGPPAP